MSGSRGGGGLGDRLRLSRGGDLRPYALWRYGTLAPECDVCSGGGFGCAFALLSVGPAGWPVHQSSILLAGLVLVFMAEAEDVVLGGRPDCLIRRLLGSLRLGCAHPRAHVRRGCRHGMTASTARSCGGCSSTELWDPLSGAGIDQVERIDIRRRLVATVALESVLLGQGPERRGLRVLGRLTAHSRPAPLLRWLQCGSS